mgnify:CR=1 FL=1
MKYVFLKPNVNNYSATKSLTTQNNSLNLIESETYTQNLVNLMLTRCNTL